MNYFCCHVIIFIFFGVFLCCLDKKCRQGLRWILTPCTGVYVCVCVCVCLYCMWVSEGTSHSACVMSVHWNAVPHRLQPPYSYPTGHHVTSLHGISRLLTLVLPITTTTTTTTADGWSGGAPYYRWCTAPSLTEWKQEAPTPPLSHDPLPMSPPEATGGVGRWV